MTGLRPSSHRQSLWAVRPARWWLLSATLASVGVWCVLVWTGPAEDREAKPVAPTQVLSAGQPAPSSKTPQQADSRPVRITIPAAGVSAEVGRLGLRDDGTVQVPRDPDRTGWFRLGPPPGEVGSSVILGHVDSKQGPAVFAKLKTLRPGDALSVEKADGSSVSFQVTSVATYPNEHFPAQQVYGRTTGRWLSLVTCGGVFDKSKGGYQSNVVVQARWVEA